jgi:hypothetical protein
MRLYGSDPGFFQLLGSFALISVAAILPVLLPRTATAQSPSFASATVDADSDGAPLPADDTAPAATMDRPAPSADYDLPADASAAPDKAGGDASASSGATSETSNDSVLEIPQIINPSIYASRAAAAVADGSGIDDDAVDQLAADMPAASAPGDSGASSGSGGQAAVDDETGDAQDYADQDDETGGGGPVVVYAAPIYVPQYVVAPPPIVSPPQPYTVNNRQLPMYSALTNRSLPMYSGLNAVPGRYGTVGGGSRLWASHLGQGFMIHGGFGHR